MKKFLSLALALVMTMSLVTISASADFADDASISYAEAVDVMAELDIIGGYADGSFAPTGTLTRGAAAKIICNMILGPTTADALSASAAPFPDVAADHTFAAYIAYCSQQGIISGYADGNFYPAGTVTAYQFMKMLLCALGYDSDIEGFTGANWSINVAKLAIAMGMDDGNEDFVGTAAMTREEACLYAFNTLCADMVEYPNNTSVVVGDISISTSSSASVMANNASSETIYDDDDMQFAEKYFTNLKATFDGENAFGQPTTTWKIKSTEIGTYINDDDLVVEYEGKVTEATLYSLIDDDAYVTVYVNGNDDEYQEGEDLFTKNSTSAAVNSGNGSVTYVYEIDDEVYTIVTKNAYVVQASADYDDDDEELKIDRIDDNVAGIDSAYIYNDDVTVEGFEEDDYILVTVADGVIKSAVLAETVSGSVSTYSYESSVTIDGTKYSYSKTASDDVKQEAYSVGEDAAVVLDAQGNVIYIDDAIIANDRYVFIEDYDYSSNFSSATIYAAAYFSDGTYAEIEVDEIFDGSDDEDADDALGWDDGFDADDKAALSNKWFTYSENSDGTYDLTQIEDDYWIDEDDYSDGENIVNLYFGAGNDVISSGSVTFAASGYVLSDYDFDDDADNSDADTASIKGNSSTVFVIYDGDDVYVYTGVSNVADITTGDDEDAYVYALLDGSYAAFVFVDASNADVDGASNAAYDYMFVLYHDSTTYDEDGDKIYGYDVIIDGEETYVWSNDELDEGVLYKDVDVDSNDYIDDCDPVETAYETSTTEYYTTELSDAVFYSSSDVLYFEGEDYSIGDDAVVYIIVEEGVEELLYDDDADFEISEVSSAKSVVTFMDDYAIDGAVYTVVDDDGTTDVVEMFIYISGTDYEPEEDEDDDEDEDYELTVDVKSDNWSAFSNGDASSIEVTYYSEDGTYTLTNDDKIAILEEIGAEDVERDGIATFSFTCEGYEVTEVTVTGTQVYAVTYEAGVSSSNSAFSLTANGEEFFGDDAVTIAYVSGDVDVVVTFIGDADTTNVIAVTANDVEIISESGMNVDEKAEDTISSIDEDVVLSLTSTKS